MELKDDGINIDFLLNSDRFNNGECCGKVEHILNNAGMAYLFYKDSKKYNEAEEVKRLLNGYFDLLNKNPALKEREFSTEFPHSKLSVMEYLKKINSSKKSNYTKY